MGCQDEHPAQGGPSRTVPARLPRATRGPTDGGARRGQKRRKERCGDPHLRRLVFLAVGRRPSPRAKGRRLKRSAHRGSCGASLKHRARDAEGLADLRHFEQRSQAESVVPLRCREALKHVGPIGPRRSAHPSWGAQRRRRRASPAPAKKYGRRSFGCLPSSCAGRQTHFTLPLVGRVASEASRVGVDVFVHSNSDPHPARLRPSGYGERPSPQGGG